MSLRSKILSLIGLSNETTGKTDSDLTSAVLSLCAGYGSGESQPDIPPSPGGVGDMIYRGAYTKTGNTNGNLEVMFSDNQSFKEFGIAASYDCGVFYVTDKSNYFGSSVNGLCKGFIVYTQTSAVMIAYGNRSGNASSQAGAGIYSRGKTGKNQTLNLTSLYGGPSAFASQINTHTYDVWECELNADVANLICSDIAREAQNV